MPIQAPQPGQSQSPYGVALLQLAAQQSAQAAASISEIGARILQLSENRKNRAFQEQDREDSQAFTVQRDAHARKLQVEDRTVDKEFILERELASREFQKAQQLTQNAYQRTQNIEQHERGLEDIRARAQLQADNDIAESKAKEEREAQQRNRTANLVNNFPDLIESKKQPLYQFTPRFADPAGQTAGSLQAQLVAEGISSETAAAHSRYLMQDQVVSFVSPKSRAEALAALEREGDTNPNSTLESVIGDLGDYDSETTRLRASIGSNIGGRIEGVTRSLSGALETPGADPANLQPFPLGVAVRATNATPQSFGSDFFDIWQELGYPDTFDSSLAPLEAQLDNWEYDPKTQSLRPRFGLSSDVHNRMSNPKLLKAMGLLGARMSKESFNRQASTYIPLTPTQMTKGAAGGGVSVDISGTPGSPQATPEEIADEGFDNIVDISFFKLLFGDDLWFPIK